MLARAVTHALVGLEPRKVEVEAHLQPGVPGFAIVGLADRACQEAKHRVRSGVVSASLEWPLNRRITVNLAPAALRKEGPGFDLPISLAVLAATRQLPPEVLAGHSAVGELALDGRIRPVAGTLAVAEGARRAGLRRVMCAAESAPEAALAGVEPIAVRHLGEAVAYLRGEIAAPSFEPLTADALELTEIPDLGDVRGQERARRALEIAAAGAHNLLLAGPPGTGKTMLARRLPGVLPPLTRAEALEVTRIHSVAGLLPAERPLITVSPFRSPHHGASAPAVVGGGSSPRPGEVSLAQASAASLARALGRRCGSIRRCHERRTKVFEVEVRNVAGEPAAIGSAGPYTLVVDRPTDGGGRGLGFNGGQLLYLAIAGCVSNDLFREARAAGIALDRVRVLVRGDFSGDPAVSSEVEYDVELEGNAPIDQLQALIERVDEIAEIPNSLRRGTAVRLGSARARPAK